MIDYLTHPKFTGYDESQPPSSQPKGGGGMATKTCRVLEALKQRYPKTRVITNADRITADTVLIEPLLFTLPTEGYPGHDPETPEDALGKLENCSAKKILYNSELTLLRMPHSLREHILSVCDLVTINCKFQADLFKYVDVYSSHTLCDPIPDKFLPRLDYSRRKPRVVVTGNISWQKNAPQVIEVFKGLKGVIERVYIGSASLWFDTSNEDVPQRLQDELYAHTDRVVHEATTPQMVDEFHNARFGLWLAYHDTFASGLHEMLMAGMPVVAAKHGLAAEIPAWSASGVRAQIDAVKRLVDETDDALEEQSKRISAWSVETVSYGAFQEQLKEVLHAVW